ncbi:glucosaminidase domain-containing protein [Flavobacterium silvaticum]|uniref:Peptidoglycan hydrolase n=1 Tax=Flavobacterium silvaticum TaxID=1852020 RepID=A0A972FJB2_9FLAO|nr:glucosaminidase domain-containing protein [Flavobacterium silvaticum]NMH26717.1 LysM peptidoglycan-binding domain-containing protein [Flavobacterium silvaticum]
MNKRILLLVLLAIFASCNSSKQTTYKRPSTSHKKAVVRKPTTKVTTTKSATASSNSGNSSAASKSETLEAVTRVKVTTEMVNEYIAKFEPIARGNMQQYGIPASIILAQGILESGAGTGPLSSSANNHFGIKCHKDWTGESVRHDDDSEQECFRKYNNPAESYRDHALFLTGRQRYSALFELDKDDYKGWAKGLRSAGYATDPKYPEKLIGLIERYNLQKYDAMVLGVDYEPVPQQSTSVMIADNSSQYQVIAGDTLYSISKRFNITVDQLKSMNNLQDNALSIGQNLRIK